MKRDYFFQAFIASEMIIQITQQMYKMESNKAIRVKIAMAGASRVGKTSIVNRQAFGQFQIKYELSISIPFKVKQYKVGSVLVKGQIWDQQGSFGIDKQSPFRYLHMKRSDAVCLCFSLEDQQSLQQLHLFLQKIRQLELKCPMYLVGCKSDLKQVVSQEEIHLLAQKEKMTYFKCSAKKDKGVSEMFQAIINEVTRGIMNDPELTAQHTISVTPLQQSSCFCHI